MTTDAHHQVAPQEHAQFLKSQRLPADVRRSVAMVVIGLSVVAIACGLVLYWQSNRQSGQARFLRLASRQRTLAELVTVNALEADRLPNNSAERTVHLQEIMTLLATMDRVQAGLVSGDVGLGLSVPSNQAIKDLVLVSSGPYADFKANAQSLARTPPSASIESSAIELLFETNKRYEADLVKLVDELESESKRILSDLHRTMIVCIAVFVALAAAAWWVVVRPKLRSLLDSYNQFQTFRMAMDFSAEHMVLTDTDGVVMYANTAAERITGYQRDEMIGKKAGSPELWGGLMGRDFYDRLWKTIKHDRHVFTGQLTNRRKNGQRYTAESIISPALDPKGNVLFFVGVEREIGHHERRAGES